ncbi:hypothetical protein HanIR_Chr17g0902081 [Helianthus annuus]|nr:hypothetical protein HanIR_Chr17g0902081 [Helianthus annuus]
MATMCNRVMGKIAHKSANREWGLRLMGQCEGVLYHGTFVQVITMVFHVPG